MTTTELFEEVQEAVEGALASGRPVKKTWLIHSILERHQDIHGADADWHRCHSYEDVGNMARKIMGRYKASDVDVDQQLVLPGYEYLQKAYLVKRDGEQQVIPTDQLSAVEVLAKIHEKDAMAAGNAAHARELRRFYAEKFGTTSVSA